jgi:hypothetical protein
MAELHIDSDWKKQAQEEKKKLAEQAAKEKPPVGPMGVVGGGAAPAARGSAPGGRMREEGELPAANFASVVQPMMTQALYYLGEIGARGMEPVVNLDGAKLQLDALGILEEKTKGNLTGEEKQFLDQALYEVRMRFINAAARAAELP